MKVKRKDRVIRPRNPMPHLTESGFCSKYLLKLYDSREKAIIDNAICEIKLIKQTVRNVNDIVSPIAFLPNII
ncbi:hypothetical protein [Flavobacterium sp. FlaQc-47]|uniref:hypothetical protein n=1 Tax=Flavobacterium sp. FlaQc-47 TaxID=3374180 RepID=UPI003757681C